MLTYFGDMGGLLDFVVMVGLSLSSVFVARLFQAALVKNSYKIQEYLKDQTPYYVSSKTNG